MFSIHTKVGICRNQGLGAFFGGWCTYHFTEHERGDFFTAVYLSISTFHQQIYHNIRYSSDLQWNHVSICMLNSGAIRSAIDERHKNGTTVLSVLKYSFIIKATLHWLQFSLVFTFNL